MQKSNEAASTQERLNKVLAKSGRCSRRQADELIASGRVRVNGFRATLGCTVSPSDTIEVDGEKIGRAQEHVYLMLNKPIQVVSTASDPEGRRTVLDFVPERYKALRLYPVGRLDYFSEGLIILTNDGELTQHLTHPSHVQNKFYEVLVRGLVEEKAVEPMRKGMTLAEGDSTSPAEISVSSTPRGNTVLRVTLHQGLNRQIRRMCRDSGLTILKLRRVGEGSIRLGDLASGEVRELAPEEVESLKNGTGPRPRTHAEKPYKSHLAFRTADRSKGEKKGEPHGDSRKTFPHRDAPAARRRQARGESQSQQREPFGGRSRPKRQEDGQARQKRGRRP